MGFGIDDIGNALGDVASAGVSLATGDVDDARAHLSDADSSITGDTTNSDIASAEARRQHDAGVGEHQRDELGVQQAALNRSVHGGVDGRAVTNFENYAAFDHPELYAKAQEMKSAPLQVTAATRTTTGGSVKSTFEALGQWFGLGDRERVGGVTGFPQRPPRAPGTCGRRRRCSPRSR